MADVVKTCVSMGVPVNATFAHCAKSTCERAKRSRISTSIWTLLARNSHAKHNNTLTSQLDKGLNRIRVIVERMFPHGFATNKEVMISGILAKMQHVSNFSNVHNTSKTELCDSQRSYCSAHTRSHFSSAQRSHLPSSVSSFNKGGDNRFLVREKSWSASASRSYSTSSNHSHNTNHDNGPSTETIPTIHPDTVVASSAFHEDDGGKKNSNYDITCEEFEGAITGLSSDIKLHTENNTCNLTSRDSWCVEYEGSNITIWSRPIKGKDYLEYKVHGHYEDIPAIAFFYIQMNLSHRKQWDASTDVIELIGNREVGDDETELVYWKVNFPRMMAKRDYVFARRQLVDLDRNIMALYNKAVQHPEKPEMKKFVRVTEYNSKMVIQPHDSFTQNGFDYIMTYIDDTKTNMPSYALKKLIKNALPQFLETVHKESRIVINGYHKFKLSGADTECCKDSRVRELDRIIEEAKIRQYYNQLAQQPTASTTDLDDDVGAEVDDDFDVGQDGGTEYPLHEGLSPNRLLHIQVPIKKISPPEYLPDWRRYAEMVFTEGRLTPIPLKRVHASHSSSYSPKREQEILT